MTIPAKVTVKAEVELPTAVVEGNFNKKMFQTWFQLTNLDDEFAEPLVATCYNDLNGRSGVAMYAGDYNPGSGQEKFLINEKDCDKTQSCRYECDGKDCFFSKHQDAFLYKRKVAKDGSS